MEEKFDFCYLSEKPIQGNAEDQALFGHPALVSTLHEIVMSCPPSYTIGLFGKWGSGKSSISEMLKARLKKSGVPVAIFDVWKHEGDSLRRSFLKDLHRDLKDYPKCYDGKGLNKRLDSSVISSSSESSFHWKKFLQHFIVVAVVVALCYGFYAVANRYFPEALAIIYPAFISLMSILSSTLSKTNVFDYLSKYFQTKTIELVNERYQDPNEFENEFINVLKQVKVARILVIFDNVDRVSEKKAIEIISTIKTFLEPANTGSRRSCVVFLIPCDDLRIKEHLREESDPNEYLKKFFNSTVHIPEFYPTELEDFALRKLKETKIAEFNNSELAWLIGLVFRSNPRQIIQFINTLISNYLLFRNRSMGGYFSDKYFFKARVLQLTKYLLIKEIYQPDLEELIKANVYTLDHPGVSKRSDGFKAFLRTTSHINIESLEPFVSGKLSENERMIPGVTSLIQLMQNPSVTLKINYHDHKVYDDPHLLNQILRSKLEVLNDPAAVCQFIGAIFLLTKQTPFQLNSMTFQVIGSKFSGSLYPHIAKIDCGLIVSEYFNRYLPLGSVRDQILVDWVTIVGNRAGKSAFELSLPMEQIQSIFLTICSYWRGIHISRVEQLASAGQELFSDNSAVIEAVLSDGDLASLIIRQHWFTKALSSARERLDNDLISVFESLTRYFRKNDTLDANEVTQGMLRWVIQESNYNDTKEREELLRRFFALITIYINESGTKLDHKYQIMLINACAQFYQRSTSVFYLVIPIFFAFKDIENVGSKVMGYIGTFWGKLHQLESHQIEFVVKLTPNLSFNESKSFEVLSSAVLNRPSLLSELKEKIDLSTRTKLFKGLLLSGLIEQFRTQLKECDFEVGTPGVLISMIDKYLTTPKYSEYKELLREAKNGLESKTI